MSELLLSDLLGCKVRDSDGHHIGRVEELRAEIELVPDGVNYVVVEYHVGGYAGFEALGGSKFARQLVRLLSPAVNCKRYRIPWEWMDLSDPARPVVTRRASELPPIED